jgi:DNA-binding NtrC family response regulator
LAHMAPPAGRPEIGGRQTEMIQTELIPKIEQCTREQARVVVACTNRKNLEVLIGLLRQSGLEPIPASSVNETKLLLAQEETAFVICQASFSDGDFRDLLRVAVRNGSNVPVIVCTDFYDPPLYLEAMELGAFDYLACPYYRDGVEWVVGNALKEVSVPHRALSVGSA